MTGILSDDEALNIMKLRLAVIYNKIEQRNLSCV